MEGRIHRTKCLMGRFISGKVARIQHLETEKLEIYLLCKRVRSKKIRKGEKEDLQRD